jgi:hypothetical protein
VKTRASTDAPRRLAQTLSSCLLSLASACQDGARSEAAPDLAAPWTASAEAGWYADRESPLAPGAKHIVWFGHSLLVTRAGFAGNDEPALDLPGLVAELLESARAAGKTTTPRGRSITFAEGPHGYDYWVEGAGRARDKLSALRDRGEAPWTHVVGIGLMHLLGPKHFDWPNLYAWAAPFTGDQRSVRKRTRDEYRLIGIAHEILPGATWVNYVGPALANNPSVQPAIDARFACIRATARGLGVSVDNAPVGLAFRIAEARARQAGMKLQLQHDDFLHLRPAGALLAAQVLLATVHGVDSSGLPVPSRYRGRLGDAARGLAREQTQGGYDENRLTQLLAESSRMAVASLATSRCDRAARVAEDGEAAHWLKR